MAILQALPGVKVKLKNRGVTIWENDEVEKVEVNADEIGEYQASRTITKYVESQTDEEFSVNLTVTDDFFFNCEALGFEVFVDGEKVRDPLLLKEEFYANGKYHWKQQIDGHKKLDDSRGWQVRKFKFAEISITDHEMMQDLDEDAARIDQVGEVVVRVYRKSNVQRKGVMADREVLGVKHEKVHEKAMKGQAKSHGAPLGGLNAAKANKKWTSVKMDGEDYPIGIYRFKYRSQDDLIALGVVSRVPDIPRPAAPTPHRAARRYSWDNRINGILAPPQPEDFHDVTPHEKRVLSAYLANLRTSPPSPVKKEVIKREGGVSGLFRKRVKQQDRELWSLISLRRIKLLARCTT